MTHFTSILLPYIYLPDLVADYFTSQECYILLWVLSSFTKEAFPLCHEHIQSLIVKGLSLAQKPQQWHMFSCSHLQTLWFIKTVSLFGLEFIFNTLDTSLLAKWSTQI